MLPRLDPALPRRRKPILLLAIVCVSLSVTLHFGLLLGYNRDITQARILSAGAPKLTTASGTKAVSRKGRGDAVVKLPQAAAVGVPHASASTSRSHASVSTSRSHAFAATRSYTNDVPGTQCQLLSQPVNARRMWNPAAHWSHPAVVWNSCEQNQVDPTSCMAIDNLPAKFLECRHRFLLILRWTKVFDVDTFPQSNKTKHSLFPLHCCPKTGLTWLITGNRDYADEADVVEFHTADFHHMPQRMKKDQLFMLYFLEAFNWRGGWLLQQLTQVNLARSYVSGADLHCSYPPERGCWNGRAAVMQTMFKFVPFAKRVPTAVASLYSHCSTFNNRSGVMLSLSNHIEMHNYGRCFHNKELPAAEKAWNTIPYSLSHYSLALAMENTLCVDYVTEKFMRYLLLGVIPVVSTWRGLPDYSRRAPNNHSFVDISSFESAEDCAKFLKRVMSDHVLFESLVTYPSSHTSHTDTSEYFRRTWLSTNEDPDGLCPLASRMADPAQRAKMVKKSPDFPTTCAPRNIQWTNERLF